MLITVSNKKKALSFTLLFFVRSLSCIFVGIVWLYSLTHPLFSNNNHYEIQIIVIIMAFYSVTYRLLYSSDCSWSLF